jgi:peptidoglycan/xylan/chitin deacetylase (PgdA/CDA1 family)
VSFRLRDTGVRTTLGRVITRLTALVAFAVVVSACGSTSGQAGGRQQQQAAAPAARAAASLAPSTTTSPPPSPAQVHANELGEVPVLMYHRIVPAPKSVYDRTPADFRAELERLATENYVPITAAEFTSGDIDIPAGTHPVVLTFDDGDPSQFALSASGVPKPTTAVGIILAVAHEHPAFRPVATFYVNDHPFGDPGGTHTLPWLHEHGFDIGNHTLTHANLRTLSTAAAQTEISQLDQEVRKAIPSAPPVTIALPYGIHPHQESLAVQGAGYHYRGAFLVGANPSPSPYAATFDPLNIPRIRSEAPTGDEAQYGSSTWLTKLAASPTLRYTSDGDPNRISYPRTTKTPIAAAYRGKANPY